ncbi:MAG: aminoglycoside phosphotransferase family protein [Candidatus Sericytochromatia bacterium]|nr:aminoglycoside phosphotransferase family protein [Candidatus Tanganyikabacteria bacterium]
MTFQAQETDQLHEVASRFVPAARAAGIREFGNGNINKTYLVTPEEGRGEPFLLQRINTRVFRQPELVMRNIGAVVRHMDAAAASAERRWEVPHVLHTRDGADHWLGDDGSFWRAQRFIGGSRTFDAISDPDRAREVGFALGTFHSLLSDFPAAELADTLPGFHVAPAYLAAYDRVAPAGSAGLSPEEDWCVRFVAERRDWVPVLEDALARGLLRLRPIHGDPKVNNILFDEARGQAIGMVDLDTVKPGLAQYDIGDCLRSSCNPDGEETDRWREVRFDPVLGRAVLEGYLAVARGFFDQADFDLLPESVRLIAFELGLRFFTDHVQGDTYFKVARRGQNLARALVQFRLAESIHDSFDELRRIVQALR